MSEPSIHVDVLSAYRRVLAEHGFVEDQAQLHAVAALQRCAHEWAHYKEQRSNKLKKLIHHPDIPRGVYMFGGVGRGKSFLMDCFFQEVPLVRKARLHFHEFMREVHHELTALQGTVNPLDELGKLMAKRYKLICFDEFHISDVTDAMILHRLLDSLFAHGVGFVTTSNFHPDGLYPDGLNRERILPAIEMLKDKLEIINVDNGTDYRQGFHEHEGLYHHPLGEAADAAMLAQFKQLADGPEVAPVMIIEHREVPSLHRAGGVVWFDFNTLCMGPRSQHDYLEIAAQCHTVMLSDVPAMSPRLSSAARRFTLLIDVLYDRHVKLVMSAEVPPEGLYTEGALAYEFTRTASRLHEMQSAEYLASAKREVDTGLV